ncbi:MAG: hypothetical protein H0U23_18130 [Blastocatellia bacterium]|nr:hypothetical protein [Blastocatellia bacterium]
MDKTALTTLREALEHARQQLDYVIGRLKAGEEPRYLRWRCRRCEHVKAFTRPMPEHVAKPISRSIFRWRR